jgi:MIP family channel proteins
MGTFALVFIGCGAIVVDAMSGGRITHVGIALTFGLVIAVMIAALGPISGAQFNPAVTLALASQRYFPLSLVGGYILAQVLGAMTGATLLWALFGNAAGLGGTQPAGPVWQAFGLEIALTAILVFVIACVAVSPTANSTLAPFAIGGTVALEALFAGPVTGASMNPARSLAPALLSGQLDFLWIYLLAPGLGGLLGILIFRLLQRPASVAV